MTSLFESAAEEYGVDIGSVTREMVYKQKRKSLLSLDEIAFLQNVIQYRDEANQGMTRDEVISLIMELKQTSKRKTCENHLDYLIRTGRLSDLKRGGRVTKAQATTVKRSQINVEQQLRWHTAVDSALADQIRVFPPKTQRISMPLPPSCCRLLSTTLTTISFYYIISCIISCFYIFIWPTTSMDRECTVTNS